MGLECRSSQQTKGRLEGQAAPISPLAEGIGHHLGEDFVPLALLILKSFQWQCQTVGGEARWVPFTAGMAEPIGGRPSRLCLSLSRRSCSLKSPVVIVKAVWHMIKQKGLS